MSSVDFAGMNSEITLGWEVAWPIDWSLWGGFRILVFLLALSICSVTFSKAVPFCLPTSCLATTVSGWTSLQHLEPQDWDVGRGFSAAEGCQQQIMTNLSHGVYINTKLLLQVQSVPCPPVLWALLWKPCWQQICPSCRFLPGPPHTPGAWTEPGSGERFWIKPEEI